MEIPDLLRPTLPPLSLYVHIPWCVKKCPYCDFNSHANQGELPVDDYVSALKKDLFRDKHYAQGRKLRSLFFGGGTPSLFPASAIGSIISEAEALIGFERDIEITLEANPGASEHHKFSELLQVGVNRLSVGVQSFNDVHLKQLGRIHSSKEAVNAIKSAQDAGFGNMNIDLMHGLPQQSRDQAISDLEQAAALNTTHLSWYQLTIEANTQFYAEPPQLPKENTLWQIQESGLQFLAQQGFKRYEVSAFCKNGKQAQHNLNYWTFGDYLGIGAGAHGKISESNTIFRLAKTRQPSDYLARASQPEPDFNSNIQLIDEHNIVLDFMMNALRLRAGVPSTLFEKHTRISSSVLRPHLERLRANGLLETDPAYIATTPRGFDFLDTVLQEFMPN